MRLKGVGPVDDREFIDIARVERGEGYVATAMIEGSFLDYVPAAASGTTRWLFTGMQQLVSVGVAAGGLLCTAAM